ncbi:hypothetical protein Acsp03_71700 [Actinomadura sp. NBRC 104412]|uniref:NUDIX domain-containing protein n=1 Tax=Actinomadura sp. NBRC 104412 TaxID=3032203 RepID=UPI0024A2CF94|nr:NUDIX domain-containing protein [Actinomadura sp. NBRC 104412]GLZ09704.1 hypothetical protein Acsp03_71700 [Actinomadura sp. NBRC 104412]
MRVRGILLTPAVGMLTIKRLRPRMEPYWVLPGGAVEDNDATPEDALLREMREELGGHTHIHSLIHVIDGSDEAELYFLATIKFWDLAQRTGPEFTEPARGAYHVEEVPLTAEGIASIDLKPQQVAQLLAQHQSGVFDLADLRLR